MITLQDLLHHLDLELKVSSVKDFGPNGLQVEGCSNPITEIATAVSANLKTIHAAIKEKAQVLIVHHGLFWHKDPLPITGLKKEKIKLLLDHNISLLAYHLPLDAHPTLGNNWVAAREMGWKNLKPFGPHNETDSIGVSGTFDEMSVDHFRKQLEKYYQHPSHVALGGRSKVSSAALISGGAHREIKYALKEQVDCYITGSFDEPIWDIAHDEGINFFAMGHYNTEEIGVKALGSYLANKFHIKHKYLHIPNPF